MKKIGFFLLTMSLATSLFSQGSDFETDIDIDCGANYWTSTEHPVRLNIGINEIKAQLADQLTRYPEDLEVTTELKYRYKITCTGQHAESYLESYKGQQHLGLSKRIKAILDEICQWEPAIHMESPVNSFYNLTIVLTKGEIEVRPQNQNEK